MVLWTKAPDSNARHFAILWFDSQSSNIFFHEIYFSLIVFFLFYFEKFFKKYFKGSHNKLKFCALLFQF